MSEQTLIGLVAGTRRQERWCRQLFAVVNVGTHSRYYLSYSERLARRRMWELLDDLSE